MNDRMEEMERIAAGRAREEGFSESAQIEAQLAQPEEVDEVDAAADRRLQAADEILRVAREATASADHEDQEAGEEALRAKLTEGVTALFEGDQDRAVEVLAESVKPDVKALAVEVLREVDQHRRAADLQAGIERLKRDYPQIVKDPHLVGLADAYYDRALAAGKAEGEAVDHAAKLTMAHLRRALGGSSDGREPAQPTAPTDEASASATIAEMAAGRLGRAITKGRRGTGLPR